VSDAESAKNTDSHPDSKSNSNSNSDNQHRRQA
jgi:hypothetical protein